MRSRWLPALTILVLAAGPVAAQRLDPPPGVPVPTSVPSLNSARPGVIPPGSEDVTLTLYAVGFDEALGAVEVVWNGAPLETTISDTHPGSRVTAVLPGSVRSALSAGTTATVVLRQTVGAAPVDSNAVELRIGTPPDCNLVAGPSRASCNAALGDVPTIEMVPKHAWYPFVAAPAGGLIRAVHRDSAASPEQHTVTSSTVEERLPLIEGQTDGAFDISLGLGQQGYIRIPDDREPGSTIAFWCTQHGNSMNPPFGGILVQ